MCKYLSLILVMLVCSSSGFAFSTSEACIQICGVNGQGSGTVYSGSAASGFICQCGTGSTYVPVGTVETGVYNCN